MDDINQSISESLPEAIVGKLESALNIKCQTRVQPLRYKVSQVPLLSSSMSTSSKGVDDGAEAPTVLVDQDELQLVIDVVDMTGS